MSDKKVGLITFYGNNYGGCLQAYAIQKTIQDIGYEPRILQVCIPLNRSIFDKCLALCRVFMNPIAFFRRRKYIKEYCHNEIFRSQAFDHYRSEFLNFDKSFTLSTNNLKGAENYTTFVCGSDQIWNPNLYGVHPIWTMKFASEGSKKIAYAPSIGISTIPEEFIAEFQENLKAYSYLSCREQEGANSLSKVMGKEVDVVLDPTLLLTPEKWHEFERPVDIKKPYIFCYLFGDYDYIAEVKRRVKAYFELDIVCLPYNLRELKADDIKLYDITPNQFVWLIENAKYVVTDSFHASVFSIKMSTPFVSLKRTSDNDKKNMNSRLYTLLQTVGLEDRMVGENMVDDIENIIGRDIDFESANEKLAVYMERDISKLEKALSHE